jgi:hypothetical protein
MIFFASTINTSYLEYFFLGGGIIKRFQIARTVYLYHNKTIRGQQETGCYLLKIQKHLDIF